MIRKEHNYKGSTMNKTNPIQMNRCFNCNKQYNVYIQTSNGTWATGSNIFCSFECHEDHVNALYKRNIYAEEEGPQ